MSAGFFDAIRRGDDDAVDAALAADPSLLRARDQAGLSPVLAAAYGRHERLAERLAEQLGGGRDGLTIFDASAIGDTDAVRAMLDGRAASVDDQSADGFTALHLAAYFGRLDVARLLLERGADPNAVASNDMRVTPLHSAVSARHRDVASVLLALGASTNVMQQGGWTPLHSAAHNGDEAIVDLLLLREADPTIKSDDGRTPIDMADEAGQAAIAEILREASRS